LLSYNKTLTPGQVRNVLTNSCIDIMASGWDQDSGSGILMALAALQNTPAPSTPAYFVPGTMTFSKATGFRATLTGATGSNYQISVSTDLRTWTPLSTLKLTGTSGTFTDASAGSSRRYYRAQLKP
jgi:hypothetical protein